MRKYNNRQWWAIGWPKWVGVISAVVVTLSILWGIFIGSPDAEAGYGYELKCKSNNLGGTCALYNKGIYPINSGKQGYRQLGLNFTDKSGFLDKVIVKPIDPGESVQTIENLTTSLYFPPTIKIYDGKPFQFDVIPVFKSADELILLGAGSGMLDVELVCSDGTRCINGDDDNFEYSVVSPSIILVNSDQHVIEGFAPVYTDLKRWLWGWNIKLARGSNDNGVSTISTIYFDEMYRQSAYKIKDKLDELLLDDNPNHTLSELRDISEYAGDWDKGIVYNKICDQVSNVADIPWGSESKEVLQVPRNLSDFVNIIIIVKRV